MKSENVPASQCLHKKHCSRPLSPSWKVPSVQDAHDVLLNSVQCLLTCIPVGTKKIEHVERKKNRVGDRARICKSGQFYSKPSEQKGKGIDQGSHL